MPDPSTLDIADYVAPISEAKPAGESLRWEDEYAAIERAREEEPDAPADDVWKKRNPKKADWEAVISQGLKALREKTKDIEIAGWVAEALARRRGLAGIRDGLRLIRAIQDAFWETAHPDHGDLELREGVYEFLDDDKCLPLLIKGIPLVSFPGIPSYSFLKYKESRDVKNALKKEPERLDDLKQEGKVLPDDFDRAVEVTDRPFYASTVALLDECRQAVEQLNASIRADDHYGRRGPALSRTLVALEEVANRAGQFLAKKPAPEPEPAEPTVEPDSSWSTEPDSEPELEPPGATPSIVEAMPFRESSPPRVADRTVSPASRTVSRPVVATISGPEAARLAIAEAARVLREADPADPLPYLVVRALRMAELYRSPAPIDPSTLRPPTTEDRQALRKLTIEAAWSDLLGNCERILAQPEGTGWLDVRRLALKALDELGLENAARSVRAILHAELRDYPDWPRSELDDGTPCAGSETKAWIEENFPTGSEEALRGTSSFEAVPPSFDDHESAKVGFDGDRPPDPWEQAQALYREGRPQEGIAVLGRAAREALTGRERFLRTSQQAELCLMMGRPGVATPLLEGLARQIDELRLDRWEDPALCARVVASLYRCVRAKDEVRARAIYDRLCQLDIGQALGLEDELDS